MNACTEKLPSTNRNSWGSSLLMILKQLAAKGNSWSNENEMKKGHVLFRQKYPSVDLREQHLVESQIYNSNWNKNNNLNARQFSLSLRLSAATNSGSEDSMTLNSSKHCIAVKNTNVYHVITWEPCPLHKINKKQLTEHNQLLTSTTPAQWGNDLEEAWIVKKTLQIESHSEATRSAAACDKACQKCRKEILKQ